MCEVKANANDLGKGFTQAVKQIIKLEKFLRSGSTDYELLVGASRNNHKYKNKNKQRHVDATFDNFSDFFTPENDQSVTLNDIKNKTLEEQVQLFKKRVGLRYVFVSKAYSDLKADFIGLSGKVRIAVYDERLSSLLQRHHLHLFLPPPPPPPPLLLLPFFFHASTKGEW